MHALALLVGLIGPVGAAPIVPITAQELAAVTAAVRPPMVIETSRDGRMILMRAKLDSDLAAPGLRNMVSETGSRSIAQASTSLAVRVSFTSPAR